MRTAPVARVCTVFSFFFNDTATTEIYTLSLHDALPISNQMRPSVVCTADGEARDPLTSAANPSSKPKFSNTTLPEPHRSEEHTSELQSQTNLVCRLLLEKKIHK